QDLPPVGAKLDAIDPAGLFPGVLRPPGVSVPQPHHTGINNRQDCPPVRAEQHDRHFPVVLESRTRLAYPLGDVRHVPEACGAVTVAGQEGLAVRAEGPGAGAWWVLLARSPARVQPRGPAPHPG